MESWKEESIHALMQHKSEEELFDLCSHGAAAIGFDHCSFGMALPLPVSNRKIIIFNNYPKKWWDRYQSKNYVGIDPTIRHAITSTAPILWSAEAFASAPKMWEDVTSHGLTQGWGQPTRDDKGTKGMLTLSRGGEVISKDEIAANAVRMHYMAQMTMAGMSSHVLPKVLSEFRATLTPREKEVLRWAADGKTTYEIGKILSLSISAVNFHIKNSMIKLNANNKGSMPFSVEIDVRIDSGYPLS